MPCAEVAGWHCPGPLHWQNTGSQTALWRLSQTAGDPDALHGWLELSGDWRADSLTAACAEPRIAVAPGSAFAAGKGAAPAAVRIACSASDLKIRGVALKAVAGFAQQGGPK